MRTSAGKYLAAALALCVSAIGIAVLTGPAGAEQGGAASAGKTTPRVGDGRGGFRADEVARFDAPVYVNGPQGAGGLIFVVEQAGKIKLIKDGKKLGGTFLDIRDRVDYEGERGLLSVAFPRSYAKSRRFYVFYTAARTGDLTVEEYKTSRKNPRQAKPSSGRKVISVRHRENSNHNGGQLQFGPDGDLYISTGDGGAGGDPPENAQNKNVLLGKILRIDPRKPQGKGSGKKGYTIPRSNPFVGKEGADQIYSYGLRNPFRFSFDGDHIAIGDVGQDTREEVDYLSVAAANGANFGWDAFEGGGTFDDPDASPPVRGTVKPIFDYTHSQGCSITGGYVSHDPRIKSLRGRYLFADFCEGDIRSLIPTGKSRKERSVGLPSQSGLSSFGTDTRNRIWFTNLNSGKVSVLKPKK